MDVGGFEDGIYALAEDVRSYFSEVILADNGYQFHANVHR